MDGEMDNDVVQRIQVRLAGVAEEFNHRNFVWQEDPN